MAGGELAERIADLRMQGDRVGNGSRYTIPMNEAKTALETYGIEPDPVIEAYKKDVDRSLIRENLKLTPTQRFQKHARVLHLARALRRAADKTRSRRRAEPDKLGS
jgi:hypothetical protein